MNYTRWQRFCICLARRNTNSFFSFLFFWGKVLIGINTHFPRVQPLFLFSPSITSNNNRKKNESNSLVYDLILRQTHDVSNSLGWVTGFFSIAAFGRGQSNSAALIYVVITGSNAQSYAEPLPSRWTVSGAQPEHSKAFMGVAVMSGRLRANWQTLLLSFLLFLLLPLRHQNSLGVWRRETAPPFCTFVFAISTLMFSVCVQVPAQLNMCFKIRSPPPLLVATA